MTSPVEKRKGRPVKDPEAIAIALDLLDRGKCAVPQDAIDHPSLKGPDGKPRLGLRTLYDAIERRKKERAQAAAAPAAMVVRTVEAEPVEPDAVLAPAPVAEPLPAQRAERAELVRRMAADGLLDHEAAGRLAVTFDCSEEEALQALRDADRVAAGKMLPRHLALEAALGAYRRMLKKANDANDWRNAMMVQTRIDVLTGAAPGAKSPGAPELGAGWVRADEVKAEVGALMRRLHDALAKWPEAQAAFRAAYRGSPTA